MIQVIVFHQFASNVRSLGRTQNKWDAFDYGFGAEYGTEYLLTSSSGKALYLSRILVAMPFGAVAAIFAVLPLILLVNWQRRRHVLIPENVPVR